MVIFVWLLLSLIVVDVYLLLILFFFSMERLRLVKKEMVVFRLWMVILMFLSVMGMVVMLFCVGFSV